MPLSQLFSIGIGPSSSHTVGPMRAARAFVRDDRFRTVLPDVTAIRVRLLGALGATGMGHGTPDAVVAGLRGWQPHDCDPRSVRGQWASLSTNPTVVIDGVCVRVSPDDIILDPSDRSAAHPNALEIAAVDATGEVILNRRYLSVGGGFIVSDGGGPQADRRELLPVPIIYGSFEELLDICDRENWTVAEVMRRNEISQGESPEDAAAEIWAAMRDCIARGKSHHRDDELPGGLRLTRRAPGLAASLAGQPTGTEKDLAMIQVAALAVNEENAAGHRVVTAPTNGAAGILPAVIDHYLRLPSSTQEGVVEMLLTAAAIGGIIKTAASISGAEVGCQGEVGSACAMAAGALCAALGGTPAQVGKAAEIGIEHHLGLTCDPVAGLVQIPCIERNAIAAVTAVQSATLSRCEGGRPHRVSLDVAIRTMAHVGADMHHKYKETSLGGLAVNVPVC